MQARNSVPPPKRSLSLSLPVAKKGSCNLSLSTVPKRGLGGLGSRPPLHSIANVGNATAGKNPTCSNTSDSPGLLLVQSANSIPTPSSQASLCPTPTTQDPPDRARG
eukprot:2677425-Rhodomonas_salina.1